MLSPFLFAVVVDVVTEFARAGALSELLYAYDLVLMSETIMGLMNKFLKCKEACGSKGLKDNIGKTNATMWSSQRMARLKEKLIHAVSAAWE